MSALAQSNLAKFIPRYKAETSELALAGWDALPETSSDWVNALRKRGYNSLSETGLPTPKLERWKFTNLPAKLKKMSLAYTQADIELSGMTDYAFSFPKGFMNFPSWAKDMIEGLPAAYEKYGDMMLWQAANAFLKDGFVVDVPANVDVKAPLSVMLTGREGQQIAPRYVMSVGVGAQLTIIEYQTGSGAYWSNIVSQIKLEKGASLRHYRFQENSDEAVVTHATHIEMEGGAHYEAFTLTTGAGLSRNQIHVELKGARSVCKLNGINMLDGQEHADTTITVEHQAPDCNSYQDYRSVVTDKASGVFQGKVHVHQIAQKTDGFQMAKSLLLSNQATMDTKPELEIYADDVKCSHGATAGRLDEDALFYLRSRGIPEKQARNLLIEAFVAEVFETISDEDVKEQAALIVSKWLEEDLPADSENWLEEA